MSNSASTYLGLAVTGGSAYPSIQYAASDAGLDGTDIGVYLNGGEYQYNIGTSNDVQIAAPNTTPTGSQFPNPVALYGAPIQIPISVDAVALAYSGVYKYVVNNSGAHSYHFNVHKPNKDGSGGLVLSIPVICGIFNGQITNWNDPSIQALNNNVSLMDPTDPAGAAYWSSTGLPIEMVGRVDSSGTTSIFYRAMAAQCNAAHGYSGTNNYTGGNLFTPTVLTGPTAQAANGSSYTATNGNGITAPTAGLFTVTKGSGNIAQYVSLNHGNALPTTGATTITAGQLGYIGPDYTLPAVAITGANTYGLNVADIKVASSPTALEPTPKNALAAFGTGANALLPPQSTSSGGYTTTPAANSHGSRSAPQDWVNPITPTVTYIDPTTGMPENSGDHASRGSEQLCSQGVSASRHNAGFPLHLLRHGERGQRLHELPDHLLHQADRDQSQLRHVDDQRRPAGNQWSWAPSQGLGDGDPGHVHHACDQGIGSDQRPQPLHRGRGFQRPDAMPQRVPGRLSLLDTSTPNFDGPGASRGRFSFARKQSRTNGGSLDDRQSRRRDEAAPRRSFDILQRLLHTPSKASTEPRVLLLHEPTSPEPAPVSHRIYGD